MRNSPDNAAKALAIGLASGQHVAAVIVAPGAGSLPRCLALSDTGNAVPMKNIFARFIGDEAGVTVIEYGLIGALISVVCIAGMTFVGTQLRGVYAAVTTAITPAL
jgi:pilus assembly protein Flp/PilA